MFLPFSALPRKADQNTRRSTLSPTQAGLDWPSTSKVSWLTTSSMLPFTSTLNTLPRGADADANRHRRRKAHFVPAVVDAQLHAGQRRQAHALATGQETHQGHAELPVGDGRAERAGFGALRVYMDPLMVHGGVSEVVDAILGHLEPIRRLGRLPDAGGKRLPAFFKGFIRHVRPPMQCVWR